jgi:hypothetical protein
MNEDTMIPSTFIVKGAKTLNIVSWAIDMVSGAWAFLPWPWRSEKEPQSCDLLRQWLGTCPTGNTGSTDDREMRPAARPGH